MDKLKKIIDTPAKELYKEVGQDTEIDYKEKFKQQQERNNWFIFNFIMGDEGIGIKSVEVPEFKSRAEKYKWYLKQLQVSVVD